MKYDCADLRLKMLVNAKSVRNHIPCAVCLRCCTVRDGCKVAYLNELDGSLTGAQMKLPPCSDPVLERMDLGKLYNTLELLIVGIVVPETR